MMILAFNFYYKSTALDSTILLFFCIMGNHFDEQRQTPFFITAFDSPYLTANVIDSKKGKMFKLIAIVPAVFVLSQFSAATEQEETVILDKVSQVPIQTPESDSVKANKIAQISVKRAGNKHANK